MSSATRESTEAVLADEAVNGKGFSCGDYRKPHQQAAPGRPGAGEWQAALG
ncbi:MAG: hypothetical protein AVDCRST_MAG51-2272 [uncultured Ramlibacter sp.]|uniref:Uncharacterized protein n=1 Tax=uncultured Ramlibacter sp. TaxID=260755 RepID=A0A6J4PT87_9BURK|nr:MAG: hypothetical protein AVDCRST_MAG51-2272 [uncultured Ramlibacter sp.]